ncbi:MAG: hypothetical protein HRT42_06870 [Campylobacteraceae bacterium]|nr:hypothetical protein [Campylobacteraceae bacterium]
MKPLNSYIINKILHACPITKDVYKGIKARGDIYIKSSPPPRAYIINSGWFWGPGAHWVLIYFDKEYTLFFDSFGFSPDLYNFPFLGERKGLPLIRNTALLQNFESSACGYWAIYILYHILAGKTLYKILQRFKDTSSQMNDQYVYYFVKDLSWRYAKQRIE